MFNGWFYHSILCDIISYDTRKGDVKKTLKGDELELAATFSKILSGYRNTSAWTVI